MEILLYVLIGLVIINIIIAFLIKQRPSSGGGGAEVVQKLDAQERTLSRLEANLKEDFKINREENSGIAKDNRTELGNNLKDFKSEMASALQAITNQSKNALDEVNKTLEEKINSLINKIEEHNKYNREALVASLNDFKLDQRKKMDDLKLEQKDIADRTILQLDKVTTKVEEKLTNLNEQAIKSSSQMRAELTAAFKEFKESFEKNVVSFNTLQRENFKQSEDSNKNNREAITLSFKDFTIEQRTKSDELKQEQKEMTTKTVENLEKITAKVEEKLTGLSDQSVKNNIQMREELATAFNSFGERLRERFNVLEEKQNKMAELTEKKLEEMRATVEEKLQQTLHERIGQSFDLVSKQLENVQKGLGEMQSLAQDVGGLKRVLGNVKMRGGIGEVQLAMLLEQVLAPEQYAANVKTKADSADLVEFAIKLPGRDEIDSVVWLPIDAKFPKDVYEQLQLAHDTADPILIDAAQKNLEATVKKMAKDVRDKYIDPPNTTDFGIMFLPFEGIYAEVVRKASLLDELQRVYKIVVTGPTTLAAILNSLQMGFRTLAIQKRSSEVWRVLGAVKQEFENFGGLLEKAQKNLQTATNQIDEVMGKRTRAIQRKLKGVEALTVAETQLILPEISEGVLIEEGEQ